MEKERQGSNHPGDCQLMNILPKDTHKRGKIERKSNKTCTQTTNKNEFPSGVINYVMEKTSYGLGWTKIDSMIPEIDPFPIC